MVVLLTGGSRGIGASAVRALHRDGAEVAFTYASNAESAMALARELGDRAVALHCDLADYDALPALVEGCVDRFGRIDVLINNGAIFEENPFFDTDYAAWRRGWDRTFSINLFGGVHLTYLVLQHMRAQGAGKIVNVASRSAHRGELSVADYGASKAALVNFTKSIARSCGRYGIKALAIAPGFIETDMAAPDLSNSTRRAELEAEVPLGYIGSAGEVGDIIAFFASSKGDYASGATIDLNGGSYVR
ncbi:MAG TPA: SDR family oxidoreductase [Candidatus Baltobacteraceae bacterium]|jgi:NAD(P)-dependent dehydrogenase (short-subunit alcohol dehydrogenase family)